MTIQRGPLTFTLLSVLILSPLAQARPVTNAELGFSFELPDAATEEHSEDPDTLYEYSVPHGECTIRVSISRGHESLDPDPVSLRNSSALKKRIPGISVEDRVWSTFTLEGYRIPTTLANGQMFVGHTSYVPLSPESLLVTVTGRAADEAETRAVLNKTLSSIRGKTNWKTPAEERAEQKAFWKGVALAFGGWVSIGGLAGIALVVHRRIRRSRASRT